MAAEEGISVRTLFYCVTFSNAVELLRGVAGHSAVNALMGAKPRISRAGWNWLARQPEARIRELVASGAVSIRDAYRAHEQSRPPTVPEVVRVAKRIKRDVAFIRDRTEPEAVVVLARMLRKLADDLDHNTEET